MTRKGQQQQKSDDDDDSDDELGAEELLELVSAAASKGSPSRERKLQHSHHQQQPDVEQKEQQQPQQNEKLEESNCKSEKKKKKSINDTNRKEKKKRRGPSIGCDAPPTTDEHIELLIPPQRQSTIRIASAGDRTRQTTIRRPEDDDDGRSNDVSSAASHRQQRRRQQQQSPSLLGRQPGVVRVRGPDAPPSSDDDDSESEDGSVDLSEANASLTLRNRNGRYNDNNDNDFSNSTTSTATSRLYESFRAPDDARVLAVAEPVEEAKDEDDGTGTGVIGGTGSSPTALLPSAVEYDPDSKRPAVPAYKHRRVRVYALLAFVAVVATAVLAAVGAALGRRGGEPGDGTTSVAPLHYRETIGIEAAVRRAVGTNAMLRDPASPYSRALSWITFDDPMQMTPEEPNFIQRYVAAYLYYATTVDGPWRSCNPPHLQQPGDENNATDGDASSPPIFCIFTKLVHVYNDLDYAYANQDTDDKDLRFGQILSYAWLSNITECEWAGVYGHRLLALPIDQCMLGLFEKQLLIGFSNSPPLLERHHV